MKEKQKVKNEKGITLVALVITIIVLIILAGVSINLVLGENGIITKTKYAKQETLNAQVAEQEQLNEAASYLETLGKNETNPPKQENKLKAGLYNADGTMLCTWEESGIDVTKNYIYENLKNEKTIAYYIIKNDYPTATKAVIPENINALGDYAFYMCEQLESIYIPDTVTSIGTDAFNQCKKLKEVNLPDGITSIEPFTFQKCENLTKLEIPDSVTHIGMFAFRWCTNLESIDIPEGVTTIICETFAECSNLKKVTIPDTLETIDDDAFGNCAKLESIYIPISVKNIYAANTGDGGPFTGCDLLKIYCEASEQQSGWEKYWNNYTYYKALPTTYNVTREVYESTYQ